MTARAACGSVRLTVASATRRVDLLLPDAVPVAELVPELARSIGLLDRATASAGYRLLTTAGQELRADTGLAAQGVRDGGLLTLAAVDGAAPPVDDDPAEVMAEVVERDLAPWGERHGRAAAWCAGTLAALLGAAGLLLERGSPVAGSTAAVVAAAFVLGGVLTSRSGRGAGAAVALGVLGTAYAAVAGTVLVPGAGGSAAPAAGGPVLAAGLVCLVGFRAGRASALPAVVVGALLLATWPIGRGTGLGPAVLLSAALVLAVLAGAAFPGVALAVTGATRRHLADAGDAPVDRARLASDARLAHEILLGLSATVGVLLVLVAPLAASLGVAGAILAVLCCLATLLRARRRSGAHVLVALVPGLVGLAAAVGTAWWLDRDWRPALALLCCLVGGLVVAGATCPRLPTTSPGLGRLGDLTEAAAVLALLPLLLVAMGVLGAVGP